MQIVPGVTLIEGVGANSNCYLVECDCGVNVLVDTGMADNFLRVKEHVKRLDIIVNTHCHYDHVGANVLLKKEFGAKLLAHEADAGYIACGDGEYTCSSMFGKVLPAVEVDGVLREGDVVFGTTGLEVVHTPGHTRGGICLYDRKRKILFSGDTLFAEGGIGRTDLPSGDLGALRASILKISLLDVDILLPGHGECVLNGAGKYIKDMCFR